MEWRGRQDRGAGLGTAAVLSPKRLGSQQRKAPQARQTWATHLLEDVDPKARVRVSVFGVNQLDDAHWGYLQLLDDHLVVVVHLGRGVERVAGQRSVRRIETLSCEEARGQCCPPHCCGTAPTPSRGPERRQHSRPCALVSGEGFTPRRRRAQLHTQAHRQPLSPPRHGHCRQSTRPPARSRGARGRRESTSVRARPHLLEEPLRDAGEGLFQRGEAGVLVDQDAQRHQRGEDLPSGELERGGLRGRGGCGRPHACMDASARACRGSAPATACARARARLQSGASVPAPCPARPMYTLSPSRLRCSPPARACRSQTCSPPSPPPSRSARTAGGTSAAAAAASPLGARARCGCSPGGGRGEGARAGVSRRTRGERGGTLWAGAGSRAAAPQRNERRDAARPRGGQSGEARRRRAVAHPSKASERVLGGGLAAAAAAAAVACSQLGHVPLLPRDPHRRGQPRALAARGQRAHRHDVVCVGVWARQLAAVGSAQRHAGGGAHVAGRHYGRAHLHARAVQGFCAHGPGRGRLQVHGRGQPWAGGLPLPLPCSLHPRRPRLSGRKRLSPSFSCRWCGGSPRAELRSPGVQGPGADCVREGTTFSFGGLICFVW